MRSWGCPARCTTCSATTSRTWTRTTWPSSSACWSGRRGRPADRRRLDRQRAPARPARPARHPHPRHPRAQRGPRQARQLLHMVRGQRQRPEIKTLAKTIDKWQQPVIDAVLTGYSNAKAEAHNRTAKLVARNARGFANPQYQARRVRMATTRAPGTAGGNRAAAGHGR